MINFQTSNKDGGKNAGVGADSGVSSLSDSVCVWAVAGVSTGVLHKAEQNSGNSNHLKTLCFASQRSQFAHITTAV